MFQKRPMLKTKKGFTLIEMLIVVLIVGILAAIALPQYQKAVERSKTTKLKVLVRNIATASENYLQTNGKTTTNFNDLDLTLSGTIKTGRGKCNLGSANYMEFDDYEILLGTGSGSVALAVIGTITNGKYKCGGFTVNLDRKDPRYGRLLCLEAAQSSGTAKGKYCAMAGYPNLVNTSQWDDRTYSD